MFCESGAVYKYHDLLTDLIVLIIGRRMLLYVGVIFVNENENGVKRENNKFVNEN